MVPTAGIRAGSGFIGGSLKPPDFTPVSHKFHTFILAGTLLSHEGPPCHFAHTLPIPAVLRHSLTIPPPPLTTWGQSGFAQLQMLGSSPGLCGMNKNNLQPTTSFAVNLEQAARTSHKITGGAKRGTGTMSSCLQVRGEGGMVCISTPPFLSLYLSSAMSTLSV